MSDLVERLREDARGGMAHELSDEAADEIERLRAEVEASHSREMALRTCLLKNTPEMEAENDRLRAAIKRIDSINDNPADYNSDINAVIEKALNLTTQ